MLPLSLAAAFLVICADLLLAQGGAVTASLAPGEPLHMSSLPPFTLSTFGIEFTIVVGLILLNAFFAMAEIALITVRKTRIRQLVEENNANAALVEKLLEHPTRLMATIQTGITLVGTLSAAIAATSTVEPLTAWFTAHVAALTPQLAETLALAVVALPVAVLSLVIGEIAPKSLAVQNAERLALMTARPVYALQILLRPVVAVLTLLSNAVVRPFGGTASFTTPAVNEEELKMMVEASEEQGVLEADATEMIHSILDFGGTVVRKVMTPRIDMTALDVNAPVSDLIQLIQKSGHSRIPVYEEGLDNIVGIVHAKDLLVLLDGTQRPTREVMRPPYFIPETKKVDELLAEFRRSKQQLAIVRDEYGVTSGVVTIEDLLEEIVGDIQDEYDEEEPEVQVLDGHTSILDGKMAMHDVNDRMGLELPEDESDTIGGFVFGLIGHQADAGESVLWEDVEFVVEATDGRRITKVRLVRRSDENHANSHAPQSRESAEDAAAANVFHLGIATSGVETSPDTIRHR